MGLTADSILARSTRRCETATGWNTAYIGANRYTSPTDATPPADDALHPMAFLAEKHPVAVTRLHFHQADQFQVVVSATLVSATVRCITPTPNRGISASELS